MCAISTSGLTASRWTARVCPHLLTNGWSAWMPLIKIRGVKAYVSKGQVYAYHRATGVRLKSLFGSPEFFAELKAIEDKHKATPKEAKPGTWGGIVTLYRAGHMPTLKPRTQEDYEEIFNWLKPLDSMPVDNWTRGFVLKLRDKAFKQHKRRFANYMVAVVQSVLNWALDRELMAEHDVRNIKPIKRPKDMPRANRPWTREEWETVTAVAPPHLLAPILLCGVLGWREGEAVTRPRTDYDPTTKKIKRISAKSGKVVRTPVPRLISDALNALLPHEAAYPLLVNSKGTPWTSSGFQTSVFAFLGRLEKVGKVGDGLTIHGLRHTCATPHARGRLRQGHDCRHAWARDSRHGRMVRARRSIGAQAGRGCRSHRRTAHEQKCLTRRIKSV
jgi:integrase